MILFACCVEFMCAILTYSSLSRLMEFFPTNKRTEENLKTVFDEKGLADIVKLHKAQVRIVTISLRSSL